MWIGQRCGNFQDARIPDDAAFKILFLSDSMGRAPEVRWWRFLRALGRRLDRQVRHGPARGPVGRGHSGSGVRGPRAAARALTDLARSLGTSPAALAIVFALTCPTVASVVFGATSPDQVRVNAATLALADRLDEAQLRALSAIGA